MGLREGQTAASLCLEFTQQGQITSGQFGQVPTFTTFPNYLVFLHGYQAVYNSNLRNTCFSVSQPPAPAAGGGAAVREGEH